MESVKRFFSALMLFIRSRLSGYGLRCDYKYAYTHAGNRFAIGRFDPATGSKLMTGVYPITGNWTDEDQGLVVFYKVLGAINSSIFHPESNIFVYLSPTDMANLLYILSDNELTGREKACAQGVREELMALGEKRIDIVMKTLSPLHKMYWTLGSMLKKREGARN